jgi:ribonuclease HI
MTIERSKCKRFIKLSQVGLTEKVLMGYPKAPGDLRRHASPADDDLFDVEVKPETRALTAAQTSEYLSVLMTVMYLARLTRPDILMPVTFLASRTHCATNTDMRHLLNILRYLENTKELGVYINCDSLQIRCTCDASYAVHSPGTSCKGHTGYNVGMGENMSYLHTRSGKQKTASTSSTDAEVIALCEALKMCIWLRAIVTELKVTELRQITVYQDNKSVIMMSTVETAKKRSKHLLTKLTYIKALVDSQAVDVQYLNTKEMTADVLSKSLHGLAFVTHITRLMGLHWSGEVTGKSDTRRG